MNIRFYHWWAYALYRWLWTPIYQSHPNMIRGQIAWMQNWLGNHKENNNANHPNPDDDANSDANIGTGF